MLFFGFHKCPRRDDRWIILKLSENECVHALV